MPLTTQTTRAGDLRRRITIQEEINTPNGSGGFVPSWQTVSGCSSVPAKVTYPPPSKKGDETITQQQVRSSIFATIVIRYRPTLNINAAMRILYGTRTFEIRTIYNNDETQQWVTIQCEELQAVGTLHT